MKFYISLLFLIFTVLPAKADYITTNTFVVDALNTVIIITSGNLNSNIDSLNGSLSSSLNINFNIATNEALTNIKLKAYDTCCPNVPSAFYCTGSGAVSTQNMYLVLCNCNHTVTSSAVNDCKQTTSTPANNPNVVAYPGTVTIDNSGTISYQDNGGDGYFSCEVPIGTTNLAMSLNTTPKPGTWDVTTSLDEPDSYQVEIYLDNIPGL